MFTPTPREQAVFRDSEFANSTAVSFGGMVIALGGSLELHRCVVVGNHASFGGDGMFANGAHATISQTTISDNRAGTWGGALVAVSGP